MEIEERDGNLRDKGEIYFSFRKSKERCYKKSLYRKSSAV